MNARTFGILAFTEHGLTPATISVTRSRVTAEGDTAAIMAVVNSADGSIAGTINIVDSIIETPNGGRICDVRFVDAEPADAPYQRGQTIGTANDVITDLDSNAIAKRAVIVPVETPRQSPSRSWVTTAAATIKHVNAKDTLAATVMLPLWVPSLPPLRAWQPSSLASLPAASARNSKSRDARSIRARTVPW
ncbi:MAG: hypothetical protein ACLS3M_02620 [Collinsella sp.]